MQKVFVTEFTAGKTLADDVFTKQGLLLIKAGNKITPTMVEKLKKNNILFIFIK